MTYRSLVVGGLAVASWVLAVNAQTAQPQQPAAQQQQQPAAQPRQQPAPARAAPAPARTTAAATPTHAGLSADDQRALPQAVLRRLPQRSGTAGRAWTRRASCRSTRSIRPTSRRTATTWELIVRKVRAGQMPPCRMQRPDPARFDAHDRVARERARSHGGAVHAAARAASAESHRVRQRRARPARPRHRPGEVPAVATTRPPASTTSPARSASRRRWSRPTSPRRRRSAVSRSATPKSRRSSSTARARTRRRTTTSRGCRSARAAACSSPHTFPSDGEYTLTVTPIFGDNMSPTGFGSVPCERLEILLDGERLALLDWQGGGRNQPANCGRGGAPRPPARRRSRAPAAAQGRRRRRGGGGGRGGATPMRVRFKTTAGTHTVGATFLATNYRAAARPRQALHALDAADRTDARLHVLPARRHACASRGRSTPRRRRTRRAAARSSSARRRRRPRRPPCARRIVTQPGDLRVPPAGDRGRRRPR